MVLGTSRRSRKALRGRIRSVEMVFAVRPRTQSGEDHRLRRSSDKAQVGSVVLGTSRRSREAHARTSSDPSKRCSRLDRERNRAKINRLRRVRYGRQVARVRRNHWWRSKGSDPRPVDLARLFRLRPIRDHGCDGTNTSALRFTGPPRGSEDHAPDLRLCEAGMWPMFVAAYPRSRLRWDEYVRAALHGTAERVRDPRSRPASLLRLACGPCSLRPIRDHGCDGTNTSALRFTGPSTGSENHAPDLRLFRGWQ